MFCASQLRVYMCVCMRAQSCPTLCHPVGCSQTGSSVHSIFQARILGRTAISYSRGSSRLRIEPASLASPALAGKFFTAVPPGSPPSSMSLSDYLTSLTLIFCTCDLGDNTDNSNINIKEFLTVHCVLGTVLYHGITPVSKIKCLFLRRLHSGGRRADEQTPVLCIWGWGVL